MAPKKKGSKKARDDWEDELGETPDPIKQASAEAQAAEDAKDAEEDGGEASGMGGGLMAALKKNRTKKKQKGKVVEEIEGAEDDGAAAAAANEQETRPPELVDFAAKAPVEATFEDDDDAFAASAAKKKGKQQQQPAKKDDDDDDGEEEEGGRMKTKKEKEREKKEREKQRKKEQAAKKKGAAPEKPKEEEKKPVVEAAKPETKEEPAVASAPGKKKKLNAALAAIQKQQEERKKREEEEQRLREEEKRLEEEEKRKVEEEAKRKEDQKAAKKLKEKQKIEEQKRAGTFKTKAQKDAEARQQLRLKQMMEAGGVKVGGLDGDVDKAKKPVYEKRKKPKSAKAEESKDAQAEAEAEEARKKMEELRLAEEQAKKAEEEAAKAKADAEAKKAEDEDNELDDWEALADKEENANMDGVKDSWDAPTDEEGEPSSPVANGKLKSPTDATASKSVTKSGPNGKPAAPGEEDDSEEEDDDDSSDEEDEEATAAQRAVAKRKAEAAERRKKQHEEALAARSTDNLRSPICCILGHVDTGKTKLLDKIRQTNVQEGEAGGITQQIGATYFPAEALKKKITPVNQDGSFEFKVPGLLVIDTPGHESFTNLRSRGSSLCNIAILVVDIMHGLEPQTLESMRLLRDRKTPFIVALNKIDRLFGWRKIDNNGFRESLAMQTKGCQGEFKDRLEKTKLAFAEQGFNSELYYENKNMARYVSLVPTSAHTGEGIPDMLKLLVQLTQDRMTSSLMYLSEVEATVLEVKVIEGLGTTIDVILSNGVLREGDRIVLCGLNGAISTNIRALLTPAEMKELRVKSVYVHNKQVKAAMGVKIAADGLDHAIAGSRLLVVGPDDDEEDLEEEVMSDLENLLQRISKTGRGVSVQASTLGSLEALLEFLKVSKIPVANISIGPVYKRDVMQCGIMLEKAPEYAVMLCFDVKVDKEAQAYANDQGIKIFTADIIYHLFDAFTKHMEQLAEKRKEESKMLAVFPCVLKPVAVFNKTNPIVVGVDVVEGNLRTLTPIAAITTVGGVKTVIDLGRV